MTSACPIADHELHSAQQERAAESAKYFLWVYETFEFTVGGLIYFVDVDGHVNREGTHGDLSIDDDMLIKAIHVGLPEFGNPMLLNEEHLRSDHRIIWDALETAIDFAILKYASKSNKWEAL